MTTQVSATWTGGAFQPDEAVPLAEGTRVWLTIEPPDAWSPENVRAAWEELRAWASERPSQADVPRSTRDELP
jgi:hypothetical protein